MGQARSRTIVQRRVCARGWRDQICTAIIMCDGRDWKAVFGIVSTCRESFAGDHQKGAEKRVMRQDAIRRDAEEESCASVGHKFENIS